MDVGTRRSLACLAAATAAAMAAPASADPVPLSDMIAQRTPMIAGNTRIVFNAFYSRNFNAEDIMVSIIDRGEEGQGFRLDHLWTDTVAGDETPSDFSMLFSVESLDGNRIVGDNVGMNAQAQNDGSYIHLNDRVFNGGEDPLVYRSLSVHATDGEDPRFVENPFEYNGLGHAALDLHQDGWFFANAGGSASATSIERTFITAPLPSAAMLGLAGISCLAARRRHRA